MAEMLLVANPHRRRRRKHARRSNPHRSHRRRHRRGNPFRRMHRRRRHNPSLRSITSSLMPTIKEGFTGALGGLGLDAAYGLTSQYVNNFFASQPAIVPYVQVAFKLLLSAGVGWAGGHLLRGKGRDLAVGGATVTLHDFLKGQLQTMAPTIFGPGGTVALSGYSGLGAYLSGSAPLVGTATFPQTYLPQSTSQPGLGAYLSGSSGQTDGSGVYTDDSAGQDYWAYGNTNY
jgi:hypothetical protein